MGNRTNERHTTEISLTKTFKSNLSRSVTLLSRHGKTITGHQGRGSGIPCPQNLPPCSALVALVIKSANSAPACSDEIAPGKSLTSTPISAAVFAPISVLTRPAEGIGLVCFAWTEVEDGTYLGDRE